KPNDFEAFNSWLEAYFAAPSPAAKAALLDTGEQLAKARRQEMVRLIKTEPEHALELAVSYSLRNHLTPRVNGLLEERVSGRGNFSLISYSPAPSQQKAAPPDFRRVSIHHRTYEPFVY